MGPKFHFSKKVFPTFFSLTKHVSQHFTLIKAKKIKENFLGPMFQKILQVTVPLWDQNFIFRKKCFRHFFSLTKHVSQYFTLIKAKKSRKIFLGAIFQKILQVIVPLWDQNFIFRKKCFRHFFSLTKHVSQYFTLINAKKSRKIF